MLETKLVTSLEVLLTSGFRNVLTPAAVPIRELRIALIGKLTKLELTYAGVVVKIC